MKAFSMIFRNRKRVIAVLLGGGAGFAYYHYIGCASGTCPITGNPWISTAYGAMIGWLAAPAKQKETGGKLSDPETGESVTKQEGL